MSLLVPHGFEIFLLGLATGIFVCMMRPGTGVISLTVLLPSLVMTLFGVTWLALAAWQGETLATWRLIWPVLLACPVAWVVRCVRLDPVWFWGGVALGASGAGAWAISQVLVLGADRAAGHDPLHAILFGNLALMMGLFCLVGFNWAWHQPSVHSGAA
ncbi:hypothetical protein [Halomonas sp. BC04]|uniref:hypothetical protein n=1 Tax=Halomonas sp. BC04 TaxID=1403540 RepID=UPI0012DE3EE5|nr:hypothetical protein [Halomonas sp. BC04]